MAQATVPYSPHPNPGGSSACERKGPDEGHAPPLVEGRALAAFSACGSLAVHGVEFVT